VLLIETCLYLYVESVVVIHKNNKRRRIIDAGPTSTVATAKIQPEEDHEEGERGEKLFHSQMCMKGTPPHFIFDSGSQKNIISVEVVK
jgi:hypothetical protein